MKEGFSKTEPEKELRPIEYKQGDTSLKGLLAWDDSKPAKAAVVIFPEWWGLTDYPKNRARQHDHHREWNELHDPNRL